MLAGVAAGGRDAADRRFPKKRAYMGRHIGTFAHREEMIMVKREKELIGIRGWLLVYVVVLGLLTVHTIALTVASVIVHNKSATAGLAATVAPLKAFSLNSVLFYGITSVLLIIYAVVLYILMFQEEEGGDFA